VSSKRDRSVTIGSLIVFNAGGPEPVFGVVASIRSINGRYKITVQKAYTLQQYRREYRAKKGVYPQFSSYHASAINGLPEEQEIFLADDSLSLYDSDVTAVCLLLDIGVYKHHPVFRDLPCVFFNHLEVDPQFDVTSLDTDEVPIRAFGQLDMLLSPLPSTEVRSCGARIPMTCSQRALVARYCYST
jgi:hypothetical protein